MLLFVGLGNPTPDSENNRHNVGFKIIDSINKKFGLNKTKTKTMLSLVVNHGIYENILRVFWI